MFTAPPAKAILLATPLGCTSKCVRMYALNDYIIQIHRKGTQPGLPSVTAAEIFLLICISICCDETLYKTAD